MFAYVRYLELYEDTRDVIHIKYIKNFTPKDKNDFVKTKVYKAYWSPVQSSIKSKLGSREDCADSSGYYDAQILLLEDTKEEICSKIQKARIPVPKIRNKSDDEVEEDNSPSVSQQLKAVKDNKARKKAKVAENTVRNMKAVLEERLRHKKVNPMYTTDCSGDSTDDEVVPKSELLEEKRKYSALHQKYGVLKKERGERQKIEEDFTRLKEENEKLRKLNLFLQEQLLAKFEMFTKARNDLEAVDGPLREAGENVLLDTTHENKQTLFVPKDGKVYIAEDLWVEEPVWKTIMRQKRDSLFCKDLAVAIWGEETLQNRSVQGRACNRLRKNGAVAKPKLTPKKLDAVTGALEHWQKANNRINPDLLCKSGFFIADKIQFLNKKCKTELQGEKEEPADKTAVDQEDDIKKTAPEEEPETYDSDDTFYIDLNI